MRILAALLLFWGLACALELKVLLQKEDAGVVELLGPHEVWRDGNLEFARSAPARYRVRRLGEEVWLEGRRGRRFSLVPKEGGFRLGERAYPGFLRLVAGEELLWVNVVEIEDYLEGVLPGEMPAWFPLEAQKAQVVLARTYALGRLGSHPEYDLCASARCHVYLGRVPEGRAYRAAIQATEGRILVYGGRPARAVYHADSGGMTASSLEVWGEAHPYLVVRPDPYTKREAWQKRLSPAAVREALAAAGFGVGTPRELRVLGRTASQRVAALMVVGSEGRAVLRGLDAGAFLRRLGLPSTMVWTPGGLRVLGRGRGHGVGLSQWGAKGLAERGFGYRAILGHYYPGTLLAPYRVQKRR